MTRSTDQQINRSARKPKIFSFFTAILLCLMFTACQKEENIAPNALETTISGGRAEDQPAVKLKNGRLCFADRNALYQTIELLNKQQAEGLDAWEKGKGFASLRNWQKTVAKKDKKSDYEQEMIDFSFPQTMAAIINPEGEYQIGDTVVLYSKNYVYYIPAKDEQSFKLAKTSFGQATNVRKVPLSMKVLDSKVASGGRVENTYMSANSIDARYQSPSYLAPDFGILREYKSVCEVYCWHDGMTSIIVLRVKHQVRASCSWGNCTYTESDIPWNGYVTPINYNLFCFFGNYSTSGQGVWWGNQGYQGGYIGRAQGGFVEKILASAPAQTNNQINWIVSVSTNVNINIPQHNQSYPFGNTVW